MLFACSTCACHVRVGSHTCPHCGASLFATGRTAAAVLLGLALVGCPDPNKDLQALYGVVDTSRVDADGDGWAVEDGDCDDANADIHPDATETPGDGVDSNCDDEDDT